MGDVGKKLSEYESRIVLMGKDNEKLQEMLRSHDS